MDDSPALTLAPRESDWLDMGREWIKSHFSDQPEVAYASLDGKLAVIRANLVQGWVTAQDTWKLQSLGIALGDSLAQDLGMDWVTADGEFERQPALNVPGTEILCFPLTMISRPMEHGEDVDVDVIFETMREEIRDFARANGGSGALH